MKTTLKWILGIACVLFGLMAFTTSIIGGLLFLIAGTFLIPPVFNKINSAGKMSRTLKIVVPIVGVFAGFMAIGISASNEVDTETQKIEEKRKEEYAKLTPAQKDSISAVERVADSLIIVNKKREKELKRQNEIEFRKKNTVSASQLYAAYDANEVSADQNFNGKAFYVTGVVEEIKKDFLDDIYVTLKTGQMFSFVNCYLDDEKTAAKLKKGQRVTFKGRCKGMVVTLVTMQDCEIVENL